MFRPFGNETTLAQWHAEPHSRGTFSVLSSCLFTISLCVWTSVHLNLVAHKQEHKQVLRKRLWLALALLAPEMVAWNAWQQRREVKKLTKAMQEYYRSHFLSISSERSANLHGPGIETWKEPAPGDVDDASPVVTMCGRLSNLWRNSWMRRVGRKLRIRLFLEPWEREVEELVATAWSDVHSWYALMGGFTLDTTEMMYGDVVEMTITTDGLATLAKYWLTMLPRLSKQDIRDKTKADGLIRIIACWQAIWFCVQFIARLAQGLSVTLLELNVFGHAICALLIYSIYWDRPRDIRQPTELAGDSWRSVTAVLLTLSDRGIPSIHNAGRRRIRYYWYPVEATEHVHELSDAILGDLHPIFNLQGSHSLRIGDAYWQLGNLPSDSLGLNVHLEWVTVSRLQAVQHFDEMRSLASCKKPTEARLLHARSHNWLVLEAPSPRFSLGESLQHLLGLATAATLYSGLHVLAWDYLFPSRAETILWQTASLTVVCSVWVDVVGFLLVYLLVDNHVRVMRLGVASVTLPYKPYSVVYSVLVPLSMLLASPVLIWSCLCRVYLDLGGFVCLAHLPASVLQVPSWMTYVPHVA